MSNSELEPVPAPNTATQLIFGREPAFWVGFVQALVSLVTAFGLSLSSEQQGSIMALASAVFGAWLAYSVRPIAVAAFSTLIQASLALVVAFGLNFTVEQQGVILTFSSILLNMILVRPQVEPAKGWVSSELSSSDPAREG